MKPDMLADGLALEVSEAKPRHKKIVTTLDNQNVYV